ncbi:MAG: CBS domain-containing protein [Actinobacteria bacterium]|nr:CBS domain-containing protein [Actinomycetota bacterium]
MKAKDIMVKEIIMIDETETVAVAVKKMSEKKVSCLIVNRKDYEDAYGIITRRDVVNKVVALGQNPYELQVGDIMTKPLVTVTPNLNIRYVAKLMSDTGVRRMPVFDGHKMMGIISNSDIFRSFTKYLAESESF